MSGVVKRTAEGADGVYAAYFSGVAGTSLAMFVFVDGTITGADASGGLYDGHYEITEDGDSVEGLVSVVLEPYETSITGFAVGEQELRYDVPIRLPIEPSDEAVFRIETPIGPVNAKFKRLRPL